MARPQCGATPRGGHGIQVCGGNRRKSTDFEQGFGCDIIAECATAEGSNAEPVIAADLQRLRFYGYEFVNENDECVPHCARLVLCPDGKMYYSQTAAPVSQPEHAEEQATATA